MKKVLLALALCLVLQGMVFAAEGEAVSEDAVTSASVSNFYGMMEGDELMDAINSYAGFYSVASVNADGTPNIAFFIYSCVKNEDTYYLMLGISPNQTTANIENGSELMAMYGALPEEGSYPTNGAKMILEKVEDEELIATLTKSAPQGYAPFFYEITEVRPLG